jgi:hypothetical protein
MSAGTYDFTIEQGATFQRTFTWKDNNGNPINLTGYSAKMELKDSHGNLLLTLLSGTDVTLGGSAGTIAVEIAAATTAALTFDTANYDLRLTDASGTVTRLLSGIVTLSDGVTT